MTISVVLLIVMAGLYACGVYLMLERSITRVLLGFLLVGNATNLLILIMAGGAGVAPIVEDGVTASEMADPLPQALILTAIVITFAVSAFLLALIYRSWRLVREDVLEDDAADVAMRGATADALMDASADGSADRSADDSADDSADRSGDRPPDASEAADARADGEGAR